MRPQLKSKQGRCTTYDKLCIEESKSADQILSQLMHDTASQSNHGQDEDHKRRQVRIVKRIKSILVVLFFVCIHQIVTQRDNSEQETL